MARDAEDLDTLIPLSPKGSEPFRASPTDGRCDRDRFHVGDRRRTPEQTHVRREGWLETRLPLLPLETLDQRGLLPADVRARPAVEVHIEAVSTPARVLAEEPRLVRLVDRLLDVARLLVELAPNVDVRCGCVHGPPGNEATFDELMGVAAHDLAVLAGAWLAFVGVDDEVARSWVLLPAGFVHKRPFET